MKVITNRGTRRLGIPGRPALLLDPNQSETIGEDRLESFRKNRTVSRWLEAGILVVTDEGEPVPVPVKVDVQPAAVKRPNPQQKARPRGEDTREELVLPEGVTGVGTEPHHTGGGWWEVYVNGFKVTDKKVRKDEALSIAEEYE